MLGTKDKFVHHFTPKWRSARDRSIAVGLPSDGLHLVRAAVVDGRGGGDIPNVQQHISWINEAIAHFRRTGQTLGTEAAPWKPASSTATVAAARVTSTAVAAAPVARAVYQPAARVGVSRGGCRGGG